MGIDACMLLRVKGEKPTDRQVALWADGLCRSIGAKHFFIEDGLPPDEYNIKSKEWHYKFNAHPLYNKFDQADWDARSKLRQQIVSDVGEAPKGPLRRALYFTHSVYGLDEETIEYWNIPEQNQAPGKCYTQDGDPIYASENEWFLNVSVWTRYYAPGYERGDLLTLCAIAEWCEANIPNCEVWYGGDSSGAIAEPWPESVRAKYRAHMYSEKGREYFNYSGIHSNLIGHVEPCGLCIDSGSFSQYGFGAKDSVHCASCGKNFESSDRGATWTEIKEK